MKYKLLKDLPLAKAGTEVYLERNSTTTSKIHAKWVYDLWSIVDTNIPEWLEEVKEPKTIYDLKKWDTFYCIRSDWITKEELVWYFSENASLNSFVTEREAKRSKLLRELATRMDKWLPKEDEMYTTIHREWPTEWCWTNDNLETLYYNQWLVFRNEEDYNKYITPEAKDLLFKI